MNIFMYEQSLQLLILSNIVTDLIVIMLILCEVLYKCVFNHRGRAGIIIFVIYLQK